MNVSSRLRLLICGPMWVMIVRSREVESDSRRRVAAAADRASESESWRKRSSAIYKTRSTQESTALRTFINPLLDSRFLLLVNTPKDSLEQRGEHRRVVNSRIDQLGYASAVEQEVDELLGCRLAKLDFVGPDTFD